LVEKNHVVKIDTNYTTSDLTQVCDVDQYNSKSLTLNNMLNIAVERYGKEKIHRYSSFQNNCQMFVKDVLSANGLYNDTINSFVYQDMANARESMPITNSIANRVTDMANVANKLIGGSREEIEAYNAVRKLYDHHVKLQGGRLIKNARVAKNFDDFMKGFKSGFFGTLKLASPLVSLVAPELAIPLGIADTVGNINVR
jgi:hypothetical protein